MTDIVAGFPLTEVIFINTNCDYNIQYKDGMSALHYAAQHGRVGVVQLLFASGAKPNVLNSIGQSPLNCALRKMHGEFVKTLLYVSSHVDVCLAASPDFTQPLYKSLCENCFTAGVALLMGGYNGAVELHKYWRQFKVGRKPRNLSLSEVYNFNYLTSPEFTIPASLQHTCRLKVREILKERIPLKLNSLNYPVLLKDFICFKEVYHAAMLDSTNDIFAYFSDISRSWHDRRFVQKVNLLIESL